MQPPKTGRQRGFFFWELERHLSLESVTARQSHALQQLYQQKTLEKISQ
jgi:hypothetical protein